MNEIGEIPAVGVLARTISLFPRAAQEQGEKLFNAGAVGNLRTTTPRFEFEAEVASNMPARVRLAVDGPRAVWNGTCSCNVRTRCSHIYAAAKALLAEHSVSLVNQLSAGARVAVAEAPSSSELARRLADKLGRALSATELNYIRTVNRVYQRSRVSGTVGEVDFVELGFRLRIAPWQLGELWPEFPPDDYYFWLYIVRALIRLNLAIPSWMRPVSNVADLRPLLDSAERKRFADHWRNRMEAVSVVPPMASDGKEAAWDFRVVLRKSSAFLEWKGPDMDRFERPKPAALRQLLTRYPLLPAALPPEAESVLQPFVNSAAHYGDGCELHYYAEADKAAILRLLAKPALASRVVTTEGNPFERIQEPLRWTLEGPNKDRDYQARLVKANGEPAPQFLFTAGTNPVLCVSAGAVFQAPPIPECLGHSEATLIPGPAIESAEGVRFLRKIGVELPEQLRGRVRVVGLKAAIKCHLSLLPNGHEVCVFEVGAAAEDGSAHWKWRGVAWAKEIRKASHTEANGDWITCYDEQVLDEVRHLLQPLNLQPADNFAFHLRVKRNFPGLFVNWLRSVPPKVAVQLEGELASLAQDAVSGRVRLEATEVEIDWFDLRVVLNVSDTTLTAEELKLLLNARGAFVRLKGKGWRRLEFDFTPEDDEQLARLGLSARELSGEPQRLHALQLADPAAKHFLPEEQVLEIRRRTEEIKVRVAPEMPVVVKADLRPYQREGFHFLAYLAENRFGGILADDMGLGKTLQTLAWLTWLRDRYATEKSSPAPPVLVVCPKSVMDTWRAETAKFTPCLRVRIWAANELPSLKDGLQEADLHVINYAELRLGRQWLAEVHWLAVILDEGQYIKNPNSLTAQAARSLRAEHRLILSGTPIENRLLDLWSLMQFAMPGVLSTRAHFARLYSADEDPFARRRLAARVRPFLLRRTKAQVAKDLPDRIEEDLYCEIEGDQLALYRAELKRAQQILLGIRTQKELAQHQFHFLTALLRLRQICCHPRLFNPGVQSEGAKREALLEQLEPLMDEGHKVLIFSQFVELLELLKPDLAQRGWPVFCLTGETENRGELVQKFQKLEGNAVFLISLKAGGFGLNLTAASYVVLFDPWWNPAVENQAIDRTHRIGQTRTVIAYRLLIKNSIEEKIRQLQRKKSALSEDVLGEERFAQALTLDDFHFLLAD